MGKHAALKVFVDNDGLHHHRCRCGWAPPPQASRQLLEDEVMRHYENIRRARAGLKPRTVNLKDERDWYLEQAQNMETPPETRKLWQRMADELTARIGPEKNADDVPLF